MATFEAQVEALTSLDIDGSSAPTQTELSQFLTDGAKEILNALPKSKQSLFTTSNDLNSSSSSFTVLGSEIFSVTRDDGTINQPCRIVNPALQGRIRDADDMMAATITDPAYYITNNILVVVPSPTNAQNAHVQTLNYPTVAFGDSAIAKFPDDAEYLVSIYGAMKSIQNKMGSKSVELPSDVSLPSIPIAPSVPSIEDLSIVAVAPSSPSTPNFTTIAINDVTVDTTAISNVGVAPSYTKPNLTTRVSFKTFFEDTSNSNPFGDSDPSALSISVSPPVIPASPSYTTPDVGTETVGTMPTISSVSISNIGVPPTYTAPVVAGATEELTATISDGTIGTDADFQDFSDWFEVLGHMIEDEEDTELANVQLQKISTYLNAYQQALNNNLNDFNKENVAYQAKLQEAIQQAQINSQRVTQQAQIDKEKVVQQAQLNAQEKQQEASLKLQKENQEYQAKLSKFSDELQSYQAQVNKDVQEYGQKISRYQLEVNTAFQSWSKTESDNLSQYNADIQNELNEFNKENTAYQAKLQEAIQQAQISAQVRQQQAQLNSQDAQKETELALSKEVQEYQASISKYNSELQVYQANVSREVQQYSNNLNADIQDYQQKLAKYSGEVQSYQAEVTSKISNYNAKIQKQSTDFQFLNSRYTQLSANYELGLQTLRNI
mgnify:FL=1|tara:strand:- start:45 stop:2039 length:1995 start_codon:yes stop_codon:yes gene_type:complete